MGGLSQISPSTAASTTLPLPQQTQDQAFSSIQQGITGLGGFQQWRPGQANQLTQTQAFNPFAPQAQAGAGTAAQFGGQAAASQFNLGGGLEQAGQGQMNFGRAVQTSGAPLLAGANQVMQTAFDPQSALYQQYLQNVQQQQNAQMALSGVGATPYAAGLNSQQLQQFNIAWQAQQLANQVQGLNAATGAYGQFGQLASTGANIWGGGANTLEQGIGLRAQVPSLAMQSALYPYQTSEMMANQGMQALAGLQQYGVGGTAIPQLGVTDWSQLLGLGGQLQNVNTQSALAQANIQNQNMQQIIKAVAGGLGVAAAPFTGGASLGLANASLLGTNPFQNLGGVTGAVPGSSMWSQH